MGGFKVPRRSAGANQGTVPGLGRQWRQRRDRSLPPTRGDRRDGRSRAPEPIKGETMRYQDKVALITAAANGIGRATCEIIAREGGIVIAVDNHQERLDAAVDAMTKAGGR